MTRKSSKAAGGSAGEEATVGESIAQLRTARGLSQSRLARTAGTTQGTISDYERGEKAPRLRTLERLVRIMGWKQSAVEHTRRYLAELRKSHSLVSPEDRLAVPGLVKRLAKYSLPAQKALVSEAAEFKNWALAEYFCLQSSERAGESPSEALGLAEIALVDHLDGEEGWLAELRAFVWPHLGNAHRVAGDFAKTNDAFRRAEEYARSMGPPSGLLCEARRFALKASLRRDERRLEEALALLEEAVARDQDKALRPQLLMSKANVLVELEDLDAAIEALGEAEALAKDRDHKPRLLFCLRHNLVDCLSKAGRFEEALALLPEVKALERAVGLVGDRIRLRWVEGRIAGGLGEEARAVALLTEARTQFAAQNMGYDVALVSLELAMFYLAYGRTAEVKALARHLVPLFKAKEVHEEAKKALAVFRQAAEQERITLELVRQIVRFLERARRDTTLRFEG